LRNRPVSSQRGRSLFLIRLGRSCGRN
jgi:hypothetical protein